MSLTKPKQIDLAALAYEFAEKIGADQDMIDAWVAIIGNPVYTSIYLSIDIGNISPGDDELEFATESMPDNILILRNGIELFRTVDYDYTFDDGIVTITLEEPIASSVGAELSETIKISYY